MWESFEPFFEWHYDCWLGNWISGSIWLFPFFETIHILAMTVMFGALLVINLRLLGVGMMKQPAALVARTLMPYANWGLVVMLMSGYAMFASEAQKSFFNDGFKFKMGALLAAIVFQYTVYRWFIYKEEGQRPVALGAVFGLLNFFLWFCVGAGGRAIGFV